MITSTPRNRHNMVNSVRALLATKGTPAVVKFHNGITVFLMLTFTSDWIPGRFSWHLIFIGIAAYNAPVRLADLGAIMWVQRAVAVAATVVAVVGLSACESETTLSVNNKGSITSATVETSLPKSTMAVFGIVSAEELKEYITENQDDTDVISELSVTENGSDYLVTGLVNNPSKEQVVEALTSGEDEEWEVKTGVNENGSVVIEIIRAKIDVNNDAIDTNLDLVELTRYLTLEMPNTIETLEVLPGTQDAKSESNTVRVKIDDAFTSLYVTSQPPTTNGGNNFLFVSAALGFFLIVIGAGWFLTLRNKDKGLNEDGTPHGAVNTPDTE